MRGTVAKAIGKCKPRPDGAWDVEAVDANEAVKRRARTEAEFGINLDNQVWNRTPRVSPITCSVSLQGR